MKKIKSNVVKKWYKQLCADYQSLKLNFFNVSRKLPLPFAGKHPTRIFMWARRKDGKKFMYLGKPSRRVARQWSDFFVKSSLKNKVIKSYIHLEFDRQGIFFYAFTAENSLKPMVTGAIERVWKFYHPEFCSDVMGTWMLYDWTINKKHQYRMANAIPGN